MKYILNQKLIITVLVLVITIAVVSLFIYISNDEMFKTAKTLKFSDDGDIEVTEDIRKTFLHSDYFASIVGIDSIPSESEKMTVDEMKKYMSLMNKLLIGLYYNNQLTALKEPVYINKGNNYEYEYKIKSSKLLKILENTYGIKATKEELGSSEKFVNSLYYNKSDDCCYISLSKLNDEYYFNFIGIDKIIKQENEYVMYIYYYYTLSDIVYFDLLKSDKDNNMDVILGNFDNVGLDEANVSCIKKKVTFKINSIFGKNKFKILSVENI